MKNGYVLEDHHGDNGTVSVGMILRDMSTQRFNELEKKGLVRVATDEEVEKGYQPPFQSAGDDLLASKPIEELNRDELETIARAAFHEQLSDLSDDDLRAAVESHRERAAARKEENDQIDDEPKDDGNGEDKQKQKPAPSNKKAAEPSNKGA